MITFLKVLAVIFTVFFLIAIWAFSEDDFMRK